MLGVGDRRWVSDWRYNSELWGWQCRWLIFFWSQLLKSWINKVKIRESVIFWIKGREDKNGPNFRWVYYNFSKSFVKMTQNHKNHWSRMINRKLSNIKIVYGFYLKAIQWSHKQGNTHSAKKTKVTPNPTKYRTTDLRGPCHRLTFLRSLQYRHKHPR